MSEKLCDKVERMDVEGGVKGKWRQTREKERDKHRMREQKKKMVWKQREKIQ